MLTKKIQRQLHVSVMQPPSVGPSTGATTVAIAVTPKAAPRLCRRKGVEDDRLLVRLQPAAEKALQPAGRRSVAAGWSAMPHRNEQTVNIAMQMRK